MAEKSTRIVVEFKNSFHTKSKNEMSPNLLIIEINPNETVSFQLNSKNPVNGKIEPVKISFSTQQADIPEAYERLIYYAIRGNSTFFAHWKEVELSWEWVQPILESFKENLIPLYGYQAGSNGPEAANRLLRKDGFKWWLDESQLEVDLDKFEDESVAQ